MWPWCDGLHNNIHLHKRHSAADAAVAIAIAIAFTDGHCAFLLARVLRTVANFVICLIDSIITHYGNRRIRIITPSARSNEAGTGAVGIGGRRHYDRHDMTTNLAVPGTLVSLLHAIPIERALQELNCLPFGYFRTDLSLTHSLSVCLTARRRRRPCVQSTDTHALSIADGARFHA